MKSRASRVVVFLSATVLGAGCGGGGGQKGGAGGGGAAGSGGGGATGGASDRTCTVSDTTGSCTCRDEAGTTPPVRCDTGSVATLSGEVGLCCQGFSCQCDAFICRDDLAYGTCVCGPASSIVSVVHGAVVSTCLPTPVMVGTTAIPRHCCYSEDLRDCTCATYACDNGRVEVSSCSLAQVMSCFTSAHQVASCSGGPISGSGGAAGTGGATGDAGVDGPFDAGARGDATDGARSDARDAGGDVAEDAGDGPVPPAHALRWVHSAVVAADVTPYADGEDVAVLAGGDILVLLQYASRITLGQGEPGETTLTSNGNEGILARYRGDGTFMKATVIPGLGFRPGHLVATADGGFVFTGSLNSSVTLGLGEQHETTFVVADAQGFVARYGADGALAWARPLPVAPNAVLELATGAVVVAGSFSFDFTFGEGTPNATSLTPFSQMGMGMPYSSDLYVASYDKDGTFTWIFTGGSPNPMYTSNDAATGLAVLGSNQIAMVGTFNPLLILRPGSADARAIASSAVQDLLVVKLAADSGAIAGVTTLSAPGGVYQPRIAALGVGSYALAGQHVGSMTFGAGAQNQRQLEGNGYFLARFGAGDTFVRVDSIVELDDTGGLFFGTLLATPSGGAILHAYLGGRFTFSPGSPEEQPLAVGSSYLLARYAPSGPLDRVTLMPGSTMSGGAALAADGAPVLTGTFAGTATFDTPTSSVIVAPDRTMFVARGNP